MTPTETLTPIGKMKGEIDGKFEAFYLAVDKQGELFINRNPPYSKNAFNKSTNWELITRQQLDEYDKHLHLFPARQNVIKR